MSLLDIPREPTRRSLRVELSGEVLAEFDAFVEFAKSEQSHATRNNTLEFVLQEFFQSSRKELVSFHDWCDEKASDADAEDETEMALAAADAGNNDVEKKVAQKPAPNIREKIRHRRASEGTSQVDRAEKANALPAARDAGTDFHQARENKQKAKAAIKSPTK